MTMIKKKMRPFNIDITFTSGQCFRWTKTESSWRGIAEGKIASVICNNNAIILECEQKDILFWDNYFDSFYDYNKAEEILATDCFLKNAVENNRGLILLRQPFFETLISFIISANNNIPRIKSIINNISKEYGNKINEIYSFPDAETLSKSHREDLLNLGCGYRSEYIIETSKKISEGYDYEKLIYMLLDDAREDLCKFKGVGKKVADCVLIYSLGRKDAYPVDTWVRKASIPLFGEGLSDNEIRMCAHKRFGELSALAQQYLFMAERKRALIKE